MKKTLTALLLTVLFMFAGTHCFALDTADRSHGQACVDGNIAYPIASGDTLSGIAWQYGQTMAVIQSVQKNHIVGAKKTIYAGETMYIPCTGRRIARTISKKNVVGSLAKKATYTVTTNNDDVVTPLATPAPTYDLPLVEIASATLPLFPSLNPSETSAATLVAVAPTKQFEQSPIPPNLEKTKRIKGYQLVYTAEEAKEKGLILNRDLRTEVFLFHSEKEKMAGLPDGEIHTIHSRAELKGKNVVLDVSFKQLPNRPFVVLINGLKNPIDGNYFTAHCEPLQGRFPGQRAFTRIMFAGGRMAFNTALVTVMTGGNLPLGLTAGVGLPIVHSCLQHHVNTIQRNAEAELQLTEAQLDAKDFAVLHPTQ